MPNHCFNHVKISFKKDDYDPHVQGSIMHNLTASEILGKCVSFLKEKDYTYDYNGNITGEYIRPFSFNKIIPCPEIVSECGDWYRWNNAHWDTKWNAYDACPPLYDFEDECLHYNFLTAWEPPIQVLHELSCIIPCIKVELDCEGEYPGVEHYAWINGDMIENYSEPEVLDLEDIMYNPLKYNYTPELGDL